MVVGSVVISPVSFLILVIYIFFYFLVYLARDLSILLIVSKSSFDFIDFVYYSSLFNFIDFHPNYYFLSAVWFAFFFALLISLFFFFFNDSFYFWLQRVFVALWGLSLVVASGASLHCSVKAAHCSGVSCFRAQALDAWASVVVSHGLSCSMAHEIFLDDGLNSCPLYWQADYYPLH